MYQVKILKAEQIDKLEDTINQYLKEKPNQNIIDMKFHSHAQNEKFEYMAVIVYQE